MAEPAPALDTLRLLVPPLRLTALAVWSALRERRSRCYGKAVEFLELVNRSVPELVTYRHFARLLVGLKAKIVLEMFVDRFPPAEIRAAVSLYFPEDAPVNGAAKASDLRKVSEIQSQFRELIDHLLHDAAFRTTFLQDEMPKQYGEEFLTALQRLLWEYILRLDTTLPRLCLQQLQDVANLSDPRHAEVLIGYLRELDPRSLQALAVTPGPSLSPPRVGEADAGRAGPLTDTAAAAAAEAPRTPGGSAQAAAEPSRPQTLTRVTRKVQQARGLRERRNQRPSEGRTLGASPSARWNLRQRSKEKENRDGVGPTRLSRHRPDRAESGQNPPPPASGVSQLTPHSAEHSDFISDSEEEASDPLNGKGPLLLYHRTKHDTLVPTLFQHLRPFALKPCSVTLERVQRPTET